MSNMSVEYLTGTKLEKSNTTIVYRVLTDPGTIIRFGGLSGSATDSLMDSRIFELPELLDAEGHAYVAGVLSAARKWPDVIQEALNLMEDRGLMEGRGDIKILSEMRGWTIDDAELESLAREGWAEWAKNNF